MTDTRLVVGAAVLRHGRVLAARRRGPGDTAGRWELPGGKVEPGESPEQACVRELREELGLDVTVSHRLDGSQPVAPGWALVVLVCDTTGADPVPFEHDALRWLMPEELDEVDWLPGDRPFLPQLRQRLLTGAPLPGGNVGGAVRIGPTVRRPTGPWSPAVHALLDHLHRAGVRAVPRVWGTDDYGREVLSHIEGTTANPDDEIVPDAVLADGLRWLREFHDAVATFRPPGAVRWRNETAELRPDEIICHHDAAAYNWVWADERLAGVIDWDMAGPGHPIDELAFVAWNSVPLYRPIPDPDTVRRLHLMADSYGGVDARTILDHVLTRMTAATDRIEAGQREGDPGMLNLLRVGEPDRTRRRMAVLRTRLPTLRPLLDA